MAEKLTRRELRHDWLIDHSLTGWIWIRDHLTVVVGGLLVVVVGFALWAGIHTRSASHQREMDEAFARASLEYATGNFQTAAVAFDNYLSRFGSSRLAGDAMLRAASAHLFSGNTPEAQGLFQRYLDTRKGKDAFLDRSARHGLAACLENAGDLNGALAIYRELAQQAGNRAERAYHLEAAARCLTLQGNLAEAEKTLEDVAKPDEQGTPPDPVAREQMLEIRAKLSLTGDRTKPFSAQGA